MLHLKNIAIVAHVDHGKTTLIDGLLRESEALDKKSIGVDRVMDSGELERERGITITAKNCSLNWNGIKINLLDTPGHADFGGEVERSLMMVDGILLLVDASEGPLPQTRFVLQKAMERGCKIAVIINKVDRPDQRVDEVKHEIDDLFLELIDLMDLHDYDLDIPTLYASAKHGWASTTFTPGESGNNLHPILDLISSDLFPAPNISQGEDLQLLVTNLSYSSYLGQLVIGRIQRGEIKKNQFYSCINSDGSNPEFKVTSINLFDSLGSKEVDQTSAGEIAIVSGLSDGKIGDTICASHNLDPLPRVEVEPPTVAVHTSVNTSPMAGREGEYLTSRKLEEFLITACRQNVALKYDSCDDPKQFLLKGRGELQLAIVFEELRRKGFELMVGRPEVLMTTNEDGQRLEPYEEVVIDLPSNNTGHVTEKLSARKGRMTELTPLNEERSRITFEVPSRGLIGFRSLFLTITRGEGLISSHFLGYRPYAGDMLSRQEGAIIADRPGKATPYALFNLLPNGTQFITPGAEVYEGMIIGEHNKTNDTNVNVIRQKHLSSMRTAGKDQNVILPPVPPMDLERAMGWISDDEWVEVTPLTIRIRKGALKSSDRSVIRSKK
ncbi:MAG: GTP-binding protein [Bdellovibrionales bacterium]|jgi:GTP-binding protein|nr:GTP-binding protein [Bdellovibrionales bacterium]MBT3524957.1 GTP-binding protein [Bdellovibrionales bacterium]MBT7668285.1 GTP-binding protein [Bdellovibrionales bacterium]MBT7766383.1 GTP-binding protein [Bdellovibrionales bacterium]